MFRAAAPGLPHLGALWTPCMSLLTKAFLGDAISRSHSGMLNGWKQVWLLETVRAG